MFAYLAIQSHEEELEDCNLQDLEKDDGIPAKKCDGPNVVESVVLKLHAQERQVNNVTWYGL